MLADTATEQFSLSLSRVERNCAQAVNDWLPERQFESTYLRLRGPPLDRSYRRRHRALPSSLGQVNGENGRTCCRRHHEHVFRDTWVTTSPRATANNPRRRRLAECKRRDENTNRSDRHRRTMLSVLSRSMPSVDDDVHGEGNVRGGFRVG